MVINNWNKAKEIVEVGIQEGAPDSVIGLTILDILPDTKILKIGNAYTIANREGTSGHFATPEKAWAFIGQACKYAYLSEINNK